MIDILIELSALGACHQGTWAEDVAKRAKEEIERLRRSLSITEDRLSGKEQECILLAACLRKDDEALKPFADAKRAVDECGGAYRVVLQGNHPGCHVDLNLDDFARAAALVPKSAE